jgi:hypothetical protein
MKTSSDQGADAPIFRRLLWWFIAGGSALILTVAAIVEPDARGYGTHTQLGLPPCGFQMLTGSPCPGCGLTTAFAHAIRGDWSLAIAANPLGLGLFLVVCCCVPLGATAAVRGWPWDAVVARFALNRWALAIAGCAAALWIARLGAAL